MTNEDKQYLAGKREGFAQAVIEMRAFCTLYLPMTDSQRKLYRDLNAMLTDLLEQSDEEVDIPHGLSKLIYGL